MKNLFLLLLFLGASHTISQAQGQKVEFEKVKEKCEGLPIEDRVRIAVADFVVASPKVPYREFGSELATMLTNALHEVNCFRVLEKMSVVNSKGSADERKLALGNRTTKVLAAQAILTGDITEFGSSEGTTNVMGLKLGSAKVRFGFILKVTDPITREVIWSKAIEVVSKKTGGVSGLRLGNWFSIAGGSKFNKAEADAVERGIIKAMYVLSEEREEINFPEVDNSNITILKVEGTGFMELKKLMESLKEASQFKSVIRTDFKGNQGILELRHKMNDNEILDLVAEKGAGMAEIVGFEGNVIQVQIVDK